MRHSLIHCAVVNLNISDTAIFHRGRTFPIFFLFKRMELQYYVNICSMSIFRAFALYIHFNTNNTYNM